MSQLTNSGIYLANSPILDVAQLQQVNVNSAEFKELLVRLYFIVDDIIRVTNQKDSAQYITTEFNTGGQLFSTTNDVNNQRPIFRATVNCGALPAAGTKTIPHGIVGIGSTYSALKIYGSATDPVLVKFIPLPFVSATAVANNLEVSVDATNVYITTGGTDYSAYTISYVVFEYVQF